MKKSLLVSLFVLVTNVIISQVIELRYDTAQFFEHGLNISTTDARDNGSIVYDSYLYFPQEVVYTFDLDNKSLTFKGKECPITDVTKSSNILDVQIQSECPCMSILGKTTDNQMIFLVECKGKDKIFGFFSLNPKFTIKNQKGGL
jgi:hypothetical protein